MCDGQVAEELQSGQNASFVPRIHWQILYGRIGQDVYTPDGYASCPTNSELEMD